MAKQFHVAANIPQDFTASEKQQARENIGASDGTISWVTYSEGSPVPVIERSELSVVDSSTAVVIQNYDATKQYVVAPTTSNNNVYLKHDATGYHWKAIPTPPAPVNPWGVNTDTSVVINNQPYVNPLDPPPPDYDPSIPSIEVGGIQNLRNNIVDIVVPDSSTHVFCRNDIILVNPPAVDSAYGYNFWLRIAVSRASSQAISKDTFQLVIPGVGWELDQYWLRETERTDTLSTRRQAIVDNTGYNSYSYPKVLQTVPVTSPTPTASEMDSYAPTLQVVLNYREERTGNTGKAVYDSELKTYRDQLKDDFAGNTSYRSVIVPAYNYTNYYMVHVTGDMAKLRKFVPYT